MDPRTLTYNFYLKQHEVKRPFPVWPADALVLDVGCGAGANAGFFARYVGCDLARPVARRAFPFVSCDVRALPFRDRSVDYFVCNSLLEHLEDPRPAIRELGRVSRTGGVVGVPVLDEFPFLYDPVNWVRKRLGKAPANFGIGGFGHLRMAFAQDWERDFAAAGFAVDEVRPDGSLDLFSVLEFLFLSIPFSSREYGDVVRSTARQGESLGLARLAPGLRAVYRQLHRLDLRITGSVTYYFVLRKADEP